MSSDTQHSVASLVARVQEIGALPAGWRDGAGRQVTPAARSAAITVAADLAKRPRSRWSTFPSLDGGVVFEGVATPGPQDVGRRRVGLVDVLPSGLCDVILLELEDRPGENHLNRMGLPAESVDAALTAMVELSDLQESGDDESGFWPRVWTGEGDSDRG
ncbi:hypothetical protein [Tessaracoccus sp.]